MDTVATRQAPSVGSRTPRTASAVAASPSADPVAVHTPSPPPPVPPPLPASAPVGVPWTTTALPGRSTPTLLPPPPPPVWGAPVPSLDPEAVDGATADPPTHAAPSWTARLLAAARFASLVYVFVLVFLVLATVIPAILAGWQPLSVVSGSMQPAVAPGSLVLVQPAEPDGFYAYPSILAFTDPARPGQLLTHRVIDTEPQDGTVAYTTKGDANRVADSDIVTHDEVVGAVRMVVPFVGLPATWLRNGQVPLLALWLLASVLAVGTLFVRVRT